MSNFKWRFYTSTNTAWEAMLVECREAKKSIDIEQYIFVADTIGSKFLEVLKYKNAQGVKVRLLLDMVGSVDFYSSDIPEKLVKQGIEVKFFNIVRPWKIFRFTNWFLRDHRKLLIVDNSIGFTGGINVRDDMALWRDTTARLEGDVVQEMTDSFSEMWKIVDDHGLLESIIGFRTQFRRLNFITSDPFFGKRFLYYSLIDEIRSAKKNIYLTTPYFIPDKKLSRVLKLAVARGVDVKILLPSKVDVPLIQSASNSILGSFLRRGIRIYKYEPEFIHAKTAVVDHDWATFGSFNLDNQSFRFNHEANIVTTNTGCVSELKNIFLKDLEQSKEISYEEWQKRSIFKKIKEFLIISIRGFL